MPARNVKISDLKLDLANPRIRGAANQHEAMQQLIDDQEQKLVNLAEDIVASGSLNPLDRLLVLRDPEDGKYIVLEGNRRALALKILANRAVLTGLEIRPALQRRLEALAEKFVVSSVEPISCWEIPSRADATNWILQRHRGEEDGRGIVRWSAEAAKKFAGRDPALQALEFVRQHAALSDDEKVLLTQQFPITTLDRLLSTPSVREQLGVSIESDKLVTTLPPDEVMKGLKRVVLDLAKKVIVVTDLKKVSQQIQYINRIEEADRPDLSTKGTTKLAIEDVNQGQFVQQKPAEEAKTAKIRQQRLPDRPSIVPKSCRLNVTDNKTLEIYRELRALKLKNNPHSIAVFLRVFVENSVDHYLDAKGISLKHQPRGASQEIFKTLDKKVQDAVASMTAAGVERRALAGITRAMSNRNDPLSIDLMHSYVHNRYVTPSERDLVVAWNNAESFFKVIWP